MNDMEKLGKSRQDIAVEFHFTHGGFSYNPASETEAEGRARCARESAWAEMEGRARGWTVEFTESGETYAWQRNCFDVLLDEMDATDDERFVGYDASLYDEEGRELAHLGGVTFKDNNTCDPYARVLFAELASEALARFAFCESESQRIGLRFETIANAGKFPE